MATRSRIGIELKDGSILSAYHHWDGYPQWLGRILNTHYNTKTKVAELIDGGDMSVCWTDDEFRNSDGKIEKKTEYGPQYYSERGEDCPPRYDNNVEEFLSDGEEYAYIFRNHKWVAYDMHEFDDQQPEVVDIPDGALAC